MATIGVGSGTGWVIVERPVIEGVWAARPDIDEEVVGVTVVVANGPVAAGDAMDFDDAVCGP